MTTPLLPKRDRRPLYQQVGDALRLEVLEKRLLTGQQLPSEPELAQRYAVSRATIREGLRALEKEGVVHSRRGHGTFVTEPDRRLHVGVGSLYSVSDAIRRQGHTPSSRQVSIRSTVASRQQREQFGLAAGAKVVTLERTRLADGEPVVYSIDVVPQDYLRSYDWRQSLRNGSLFDVLGRAGVRLSHTRTVFHAMAVDATVADRLGLDEGGPVLRLDETVYDEADRPVVLSLDYYRTDRIEVQLVRQRQA
ncbi:MAG: GntR family transcriptional regulator [Symbiobacteriia bacterium]